MKYVLIVLCLFASGSSYSQRLTAKVLDATTSVPLPFVTISSVSGAVIANGDGVFTLPVARKGDVVRIGNAGYKTYELTIDPPFKDTIIVPMQRSSIMLNQVTINTTRNHKADSLRLRKEFSAAFNAKSPEMKDLIVAKADLTYEPDSYNRALNNTTEILSINLLSVWGMINKHKTPISKLRKTLIKDEEANYIDQIFSKEKVIAITSLKGDSLRNFMDAYRPNANQLRKMTTYDVLIYIKNSYKAYTQSGNAGYTSPF